LEEKWIEAAADLQKCSISH